MFSWFTAAAIISIACEAYDAFVKEGDADIMPAEYVEIILSAINQAKVEIISEIINEMRLMRLADLDGDVMGFATRFAEYDRYDRNTEHDKWQSEGERIREIIDDSAMVIADLESEQERLDLNVYSDLDHAVKVFALNGVLIPFRSMVMAERSKTYETDDIDEIPTMWERILARADILLTGLRKKSDTRFSSDIVARRGEPMGDGKFTLRIGYTFEGRFKFVGEALPDKDQSLVRRLARRQLQKHKNSAATKYPGMEVVTTVIAQAA